MITEKQLEMLMYGIYQALNDFACANSFYYPAQGDFLGRDVVSVDDLQEKLDDIFEGLRYGTKKTEKKIL